jgi:hypothetical protein
LVQISGSQAGNQATNAENSNFIGNQAGSKQKNASNSNFLGFNLVLTQLVLLLQISLVNSWVKAQQCSEFKFLWYSVGYGATDAYQSTFIGTVLGFKQQML